MHFELFLNFLLFSNADPCDRSHVGVVREEWDRKLSFSMTVAEHSTETRAEMLAEVLTALHTLGE